MSHIPVVTREHPENDLALGLKLVAAPIHSELSGRMVEKT